MDMAVFSQEILWVWMYVHMVWKHCCSVAKLCPTLCDPMNCSMPGFPDLYYLPEFAQTHVHWVSDTIQPSYSHWSLLLLSPIFPIIRVFSKESAPHIRWSKYCSFSISPSNQYSGLISFRIDWFDLPAVWTDIMRYPLGGGNMHNF